MIINKKTGIIRRNKEIHAFSTTNEQNSNLPSLLHPFFSVLKLTKNRGRNIPIVKFKFNVSPRSLNTYPDYFVRKYFYKLSLKISLLDQEHLYEINRVAQKKVYNVI